jgi:ABC-type dipeptide/oligopeptide/nickel transport system permease subunit
MTPRGAIGPVADLKVKPSYQRMIESGRINFFYEIWSRLKKNYLALLGLAIIIFLILTAVFAPLIAPYDPLKPNFSVSLEKPSFKHFFGTDILGRDIFSRIVFGSRISLIVGIVAVGIMVILGIFLGGIAGYFEGFIDTIIMRMADVFFAFPYVLGSIAIMTVLGPGIQNIFIAIGILGWSYIARIFRATILSVKRNEYIEAAKALGAGDFRIMTKHILPNSIAPVVVYSTMSVGGAVIAEAALSFLGLGVQPPTPAWGYMLSESLGYIFTAPWLIYFPGIAIIITVLGFILLGDGLRDALDSRKNYGLNI